MAEPYKHIYKVDLNQPLKRFDVGDILASGDEKANSFEVTVCRDGANVDLTGCAVYGYFIRPNEETMKVDGTASGNKACVDLSKSCYVYDGAFSFAIKIVGNGITQTAAVFDGRIVKTTTDSIVDGDRVIYGLEDLLSQIAATEAAASNANTAASSANTAAGKANTATTNANNAASSANTAADRANSAAQNWEDGTAANANTLGGKPPEYYIQPVNLLDNSDFRNPVNQRGQTTYTGKSYAYTLDRWLISNGTTVINLLDNGIELDNTNNSNNVDFYQVLPITLNDGIYTFVINTTDGIVYCCASVSGTTITNISRVSMDTISANIMYTNSLKFYVKGTVKGGSVSTILWVALYEGTYTAETLPPYVPKGYAVELMECQRYYYGISTTDAYLSWHGYFQSATEARFTIPIGTQMRANPTLTFSDIGSLRIYGGGVTSIPSTINEARVIGNSVVLSLGGFTNGGSGEVVAKINTTFALSADL